MSEPDDSNPKQTTAGHLLPNSPVTLKEAAEIVLRGLVPHRTLVTAVNNGELRGYRFTSSQILTTPADIERWMQTKVIAAYVTQSSYPTPRRRQYTSDDLSLLLELKRQLEVASNKIDQQQDRTDVRA